MNESQHIETGVGQKPLFDYTAYDQEVQITLRLRASEIKTLAKRVASDIVEIGGKLAEVKDSLGGNGRFNEWLSSELGWSERTAYNFIGVWQKFSAANFALENVATSALYLLAAPSTPPEALESAKRLADDGQEVTHGVAKALIAEANEARKAQAPGFFDGDGEEDDPDHADLEEESTARAAGAKRPAKTPAAPTAKAGSTVKEVEAAWRKYGVMITIQLLPAKHADRSAMVTVRAGDLEPLTKVKRESDVMFVGAVLEVVEQYKNGLPALIAKARGKTAAKPAAKPVAKTAAKPAAKQAPKAGAKQNPKGAKQKTAKAGK
jgi:hypothetical protein